MHRVIYLLVKADGHQDAISTATETFEDELKDNDKTTYDYCKPMESGHNVAGSDRWGSFEDEPTAAPLTDQQAIDWIERGLKDTKLNFAGNLHRFLESAQYALEESVETAPEALAELMEYSRENAEKTRRDAAEELLESHPRTIEALYDGDNLQHRYNAECLSEGNLMEAHVFDAYTYDHIVAADGSYRIENVEDLLDRRASDAWVVPLDAHF